MKLAISSLLLVWTAVQVAAGQTSTPPSEPFLVRISDAQISMTPTAGPNNVSNCIVVYPGGRSYLELHRQEFFYGRASVVGYEGKLSVEQLTSLKAKFTFTNWRKKMADIQQLEESIVSLSLLEASALVKKLVVHAICRKTVQRSPQQT